MGVRDLQAGNLIQTELVVKEKSLRDFKNKPGRYLCLTLADESGQIEARAWENAEELAEGFDIGDIVFVQGLAESFKDKIQLKISSIVKRPTADVSKFIPTLKEEQIDELGAKLKAFIAAVNDQHLRALLETIFGDAEIWQQFSHATAARSLHSAYIGGLLEHTVHVVTLCESVCVLFPEVNHDLLITAAMLHDMGKLDLIELRGASFEYTDEGKLMGEPVLSERRMSAAAKQVKGFPHHYLVLLSHLILSHHGEFEYGAPIKPMTLEAFILHHVDNLEAKTNGVISIMKKEKDPTKAWSEFSRTLDRYIYLIRPEDTENAGEENN